MAHYLEAHKRPIQNTMVKAIPFSGWRGGTRPLAVGPMNPGLSTGRADQTGRAGGCQTWGPADRSSRRTARSGISRIGGQAGTQCPDLALTESQSGKPRQEHCPHSPCRLCVCLLMVRHWRPSAQNSQFWRRLSCPVAASPLGLCPVVLTVRPNQDRRRETARRQTGSVRQRVLRVSPASSCAVRRTVTREVSAQGFASVARTEGSAPMASRRAADRIHPCRLSCWSRVAGSVR